MLLGMMIADGLFFCPLPHRVLGVILFEVWMLCFIVTFHVTTLDKGNKTLQIKHIGFLLPTGSTNAYLSVHSVLNKRFLESTFLFLSGLKHAMIFVRCAT